ncbi:MAG TPA: serine hydrolase [Anaeromyxobacter sp.]|nr:serine hydrolase [Anaeromyxobacter sp.]
MHTPNLRSGRVLIAALLLSCTTSQPSRRPLAKTQAVAPQPLAADTPATTAEGNRFLAPAGWTISVRGPATIVEAPEGDSRFALVDVHGADAAAAVRAAWEAYGGARWPLKTVTRSADKDGWTDLQVYEYQTSPNERRDVELHLYRANDTWTAVIYDMSQPVGEKRLAQVLLVFDRLLPRGYERESFAGRPAHPLDKERVGELLRFVELGRRELGIPGVGIGLIERGKVVVAGGSGVRELGGNVPVDADTLFMIASNTKAMTTLMLAKLVDEGRITWDTPVTELLPSFRLGDADTTRQVRVKHLICACTGMPRQDLEWTFQFHDVTPEGALATLATMQPTSKFGELFQYSNPLASAGGYVGGHVAYPDLELGRAYDEAMRTRVLGPLGMSATTCDFGRALRSNHAEAHAPDIDGHPARALMEVNYSIIPLRPAGAAWSSVNDMLRYISMELAEGTLPDGTRYISREALLARRTPQVSVGRDQTYGMGLEVDRKYGIPVVHHGGDMIGFHSDMMWLPEQGVGAVVLTNSDPGWILRTLFRRKLLEVLFDGKAEADARLVADGQSFFDEMAGERRLLTVPADPVLSATLADHYHSAPLGEINVRRSGGGTVFEFSDWKSEVGSRKNPDGTVSFITTVPGMNGLEFVASDAPQRALILRDAQHEYTFLEQ